MRARAVVNLLRLHTAGWEILVFLSGPLFIRAQTDYLTWVVLAVLAVLVNSFIFVLNDLADLPRDQLDPKRANSPLVSREIAPALALAISVALPICMWVIISADRWSRAASVSFALCMLLGTYLDVYQKTSRWLHPIISDALFAAAMAAPIIVGIAAVRGHIPTVAWLLAGSFVALCLALNSIGGNLKDIDSDVSTGFRTIAVALGVKMVDQRINFTRAYGTYVCILAFVVGGLLIWTGFEATSGWKRIIVVVLVSLLGIGIISNIRSITNGRRQPSPRGRDLYFVWGMVAYIVILAARSDLVPLAAVLGVVAIWEGAFRLFWNATREVSGVTADG